MDPIVFVVQWLHVGLGIIWFGAALFQALILFPALDRFPIATQRQIGHAIGMRAFTVIRPVAVTVITLGVIRGTVLGPIQDLEALATPYGITWLVALVVAFGAVLWAELVIRPSVERLAALTDADAALHPSGAAALAAAGDVAKRNAILELGFFAVIFTCMVLMRFGL